MNYSDIQTKPIHKNVHWPFFLAIILFTFFSTIAEAKLTIEECNKKQLDLLMSGFVTTGDAKNFNIVQYKQWSATKALFQGECSHASGASGALSAAEKNLQEAIKRCEANGQGSNCGVGPVATSSQQNNIQTQTNQTPIAADGLVDDPKVFGGSSSGKRLNR